MGLNDELEKIRLAEEWVKTLPGDTEGYRAAMSHLTYVAQNDDSPRLKKAAQDALERCQPRYWLE